MHIAVIFDFTIQGFLQSDSVFQKPQKDRQWRGKEEGLCGKVKGRGKTRSWLPR